MKPEEVKLSDWMRIIFGQVPVEFYIELVIRAFLVYLLLMVCMRLLGKRMSGQMSRLELAALVALASAVGVPMLSPINGVLPAIIIGFIIVGISRLISYLSTKSEKVENMAQGDLDTLVRDGVLHLNIMKRVRVTRERLFAQLRSENLYHLGKIKRVYMEANGTFTLVTNKDVQPGLLILPDWDEDFVNENVQRTNITICKECGDKLTPGKDDDQHKMECGNCKANDWTQAVIDV